MRGATRWAVGLVTVGALGCGGDERAGQAPTDVGVFPRDAGVALDQPAPDIASDTSAPTDQGSPDVGVALDAPADSALRDVPDAGRDVPDAGRDVPSVLPRLCGFSDRQINALAVRVATCLRRPPQEMLNLLWRPDSWEEGAIARRPCPALALCAANATGCAGVMGDCLKYIVAPADMGTCAPDAQRCAAGDRLAQSCSNGLNTFDDCQSTGWRCVATSTQAQCVQPAASPCAEGSPPRCVGDILQRCELGVYVNARDCAVNAGRCDAARNGCVGTGAACTGDALRCDGTRLQRCLGGRAMPYDCGQLVAGATCRTRAESAYCGTATECDPSAAPPAGTCEGDTLVLCGGGATLRFDCRAAGFRGCSPTGCLP
jgi:hypothetical protein